MKRILQAKSYFNLIPNLIIANLAVLFSLDVFVKNNTQKLLNTKHKKFSYAKFHLFLNKKTLIKKVIVYLFCFIWLIVLIALIKQNAINFLIIINFVIALFLLFKNGFLEYQYLKNIKKQSWNINQKNKVYFLSFFAFLITLLIAIILFLVVKFVDSNQALTTVSNNQLIIGNSTHFDFNLINKQNLLLNSNQVWKLMNNYYSSNFLVYICLTGFLAGVFYKLLGYNFFIWLFVFKIYHNWSFLVVNYFWGLETIVSIIMFGGLFFIGKFLSNKIFYWLKPKNAEVKLKHIIYLVSSLFVIGFSFDYYFISYVWKPWELGVGIVLSLIILSYLLWSFYWKYFKKSK